MDRDLLFGFIVPRGGISPLKNYLFKNTLLSLEQQKYKNWVAVVVSPCPEEVGSNIRYVYKEQSNGTRADDVYSRIAVGRDFLKTKFNPDFVGRLDDDDLINPNALTELNTLLKANKRIEIVSAIKYPAYDILTGERMYIKSHWLPGTTFFKFDKYFDIHTKEHSRNFHKLIEPPIRGFGMPCGRNYCDFSDLFCRIIYSRRISDRLKPDAEGSENFEVDHNVKELDGFETLIDYYENYKEFLNDRR